MPFVKGQSGNPGGRPSEARQQLAELLDEQFPLAKRRKVIKLLVEDATSDEYERRKEARPLLLAYTFGKPTERQEITGASGGPVEIHDARDRLTQLLTRHAADAAASGDPGGDPDADAG